jgi:NAD(P)-dependent dehydrogenase (short-subunit alcohol dehydrogenase family)
MPSKAVLITGSSTGIGKAAALLLDRRGHKVYACVRKEADAETLRKEATGALTPVILDVTKADTIAATRELLERELGDTGLGAVVNNAGIAVTAPLECIPMDDLRWQFEVNVFGQIAVTQAFMPLIRKALGRVIFVGSLGGWVAPPLQGPYCGTKFALEGFCDAMRVEMAGSGIFISLIKPGAIATPIWERGADIAKGVIDRIPADLLEPYRPAMERLQAAVGDTVAHAIPPETVAEAIFEAVTAPTPKARYLVGSDAKAGRYFRLLPDVIKDRLILRYYHERASRGASKTAPAGV